MFEQFRNMRKYPQFCRLTAASAFGRFGDSIDVIVQSWLIYSISQKASLSALNLVFNYVPTVILQPVCGAFVEKRDHRRVMILADAGRTLLVLLLLTAYLTGRIRPWMILCASAVVSTLEAFRMPAGTAMLPDVMDTSYYEEGQAVTQTVTNLCELAGSAAAGLITGILGVGAALCTDALCFALSGILIASMKVVQRTAEKVKENVWKSLKEGLGYVMTNKATVWLVTSALLVNGLMVPFRSLIAAVCSEMYGGGAELMSWISAWIGTGSIIGSLLYVKVSEKTKSQNLMSAVYITIAVTYVLFVLLSSVESAVVLRVLLALIPFGLGAMTAFFNVSANVMILKTTDTAYLSRVAGFVTATCTAGIPLASLITSFLAARLALANILLLTGGITFAAGLGMMMSAKQVEKTGVFDQKETV